MDHFSEPSSSTNQKPNPRRTILVVEDEKLMLRLLAGTLSEHGYAVFTAADGEEAIETYGCHKTEIDVVMLDVGLPKVKGVDVLHKMKSENPGLRVVITSGYLEAALRARMREAGVEHFIQKPYMLDKSGRDYSKFNRHGVKRYLRGDQKRHATLPSTKN